MSSFRRRLVAIAVSTALAAGAALVAVTSPATAAGPRPDFQQPFPCGSTGWWAFGRDPHGTSRNSFPADMNWGNGRDDEGKPIVASAAGTVTVKADAWNTVKVDHGGGWSTIYRHMRGIVVTSGQWVESGAVLGHLSDYGSAGSYHLHYEQLQDGVVVRIVLDGVTAPDLRRDDTWQLPASNNCSTIGDGSIVRTPDGAIWVVAGGAKYHLSPTEYAQLGSPAFRNVSVSALEGFGLVPSDTFLRNPATGAIYQVVGGFRYHLSAGEYAAIGSPRAHNVPSGFIARANRSTPNGVLFLRDPASTKIYQVIGGIKHWLTAAEYSALGSPTWTGAPAGLIATIPDSGRPSGVWFLRDPQSTKIYQVIGGVKLWLTAAEYAALGSPEWVGAAAGYLARIPNAGVPSGSWYLRDPANGAIYQVTGGTKRWLTAKEYAKLGSPAWIGAPARLLNLIPTVT